MPWWGKGKSHTGSQRWEKGLLLSWYAESLVWGYLSSSLSSFQNQNVSLSWFFPSSLVAQLVKNLPAMRETWVQSLGWKDALEKGMAYHFSIFALRTPWTSNHDSLFSSVCSELQHTGSSFPTRDQISAPALGAWRLSHCITRKVAKLCFPGGSAGKESICNAGDLGSIPGLERCPGKGNGYSLQILAWRIPWTV